VVGTSGTGGGFEKFCAGDIDISDASRPIKDEEIAACEAAGIKYEEVTVANDGLAVVVNPENDWATCLTVEQLNQIWGPESTVKNWNEVDPSFPDEEIQLFGPGTDSGTFDYFTDVINGEEGASRTDYQPSEDDNVIVQGVQGSPGAMGYFGLSYVQENEGAIKAIEVDGGEGCVAPTRDRARRQLHAAGPPLFVYARPTRPRAPGGAGVPRVLHREREGDRRAGAVRRAVGRAAGRGRGEDRQPRGPEPACRARRAAGRARRARPSAAPCRPRPGARVTTAPRPPARPGRRPSSPVDPARQPRYGERVVEALLVLAALLSVLTTIGIVLSLLDGTSSSSARSASWSS
jgi:hypothetical protein